MKVTIGHSLMLKVVVETGMVFEYDNEDSQWCSSDKTIYDVMHDIDENAKSFDGEEGYKIEQVGDMYFQGDSLGWYVCNYVVSWKTKVNV